MRNLFAIITHFIFVIITLFMITRSNDHKKTEENIALAQRPTIHSLPTEYAWPAKNEVPKDAAWLAAEQASSAAANAAVAAAEHANNNLPYNMAKTDIGFKLQFSDAAEIHAIGVYEAENPNKVVWWEKCGQLSHVECHRKYAGQHDEETINVSINYKSKPIILLLMAYEPINWNIKIEEGKVEGIILAGYHAQNLNGISNVPVYAYTHESSACQCHQGNGYFYAYENKIEIHKKIFQLTNKNISSFQGKYSGKSFFIGDINKVWQHSTG